MEGVAAESKKRKQVETVAEFVDAEQLVLRRFFGDTYVQVATTTGSSANRVVYCIRLFAGELDPEAEVSDHEDEFGRAERRGCGEDFRRVGGLEALHAAVNRIGIQLQIAQKRKEFASYFGDFDPLRKHLERCRGKHTLHVFVTKPGGEVVASLRSQLVETCAETLRRAITERAEKDLDIARRHVL